MASFQFRTPGSIISAPGGVGQIGVDYALRSARRVLLITDATLVDLGIAGRVEEPLRDNDIEVFTFAEVEPEPSAETVRRATAFGCENDVDGVVGLGEGEVSSTVQGRRRLHPRRAQAHILEVRRRRHCQVRHPEAAAQGLADAQGLRRIHIALDQLVGADEHRSAFVHPTTFTPY